MEKEGAMKGQTQRLLNTPPKLCLQGIYLPALDCWYKMLSSVGLSKGLTVYITYFAFHVIFIVMDLKFNFEITVFMSLKMAFKTELVINCY